MSILEYISSLPQKTFKWLVLIIVCLGAISFALVWYGTPSFSEKDVVLTLEGPTQAASGDEAVYRLNYKNNTRYPLKELQFRFFYAPDSVVIKEGKVYNEESELFKVDELSPGDSGSREFRAFLVGDKGNLKEAKIDMVFNAGNLKSAFQKSSTVSTAIVSLPVSLTLVAPPSMVAGQAINYILDYRNESANDISDLQFEFKLPDGFTFSRATPESNGGQYIWNIPLLRRGSGARILIEGKLSGNERDAKTLSVILRRKISGQYINYEKAESTTIMSSPLLFVDLRVNDSTDYSAVIGDQLRYTIRYQNNYNQNLIGLTLGIRLEGEMFDLTTLDDRDGYFDGATNTVIFNSGAIPDFASLAPGKGGRVDFAIRLKPGFPSGGAGSRNFFVKATAVLSTFNVPSGIDASEISTQSSLITKISTQPTLTQLIYYNDPAFGSSGPMPMLVDQETVFTVHWQLINPGNDMNEARVETTLPSGVTWKNVVSSGANQTQPMFDKNKSQVVWNIGVLPQGTGVLTSKYEASFQISVKPGINDKGKALSLLKNTIFSGTDSFTKQAIQVRLNDPGTNNIVDRPGEGTVH